MGGELGPHHHGDEITAVTVQRGEQIKSRRAGKTGFDAVYTIDCSKQMVVIAHRLAVINKIFCREKLVIARKSLLDGAPEQGLIAGGGDLVIVR